MIRVLDPATAVSFRPERDRKPDDDDSPGASEPELRPTAYAGEKLLARSSQADGVDQGITDFLDREFGWQLRPAKGYEEYRRRRDYDVGVKLVSQRPRVLELTALRNRLAAEPDAWIALQQIRARFPELAGQFELVHVLAATTLTGIGGGYWSGIGGGYWSGIGGGYWSGIGGGYWSGIGTSATPAEYGIPGLGGRAPVALVVADPARTAPRLGRHPVVVMPDTGIGVHPWFRDLADRHTPPALWDGVSVHGSPVADVENGVRDNLTGDMQRLAGHGTFIAGIIRQACPAAALESHAVMDASGTMDEDVLLKDLHDLLERQLGALEGDPRARVVDVLTLSAGYYHENGDDVRDTSIAEVLGDLGRVGVLVVAGAGNDATREPMLPAALAPRTRKALDPQALPLVSVGALNPNGTTVSLFSNAGEWVTTYRTGAAIVSTLPVNLNPGVQSSQVAGAAALTAAQLTIERRGGPRERSTIDRDDYSGGFGVWSGTSFATPVLAGELTQALVQQGTDAVDLTSLLDRGWAALGSVLGISRP